MLYEHDGEMMRKIDVAPQRNDSHYLADAGTSFPDPILGPPGVLLKDAGQGVWLRMRSTIISKRDK